MIINNAKSDTSLLEIQKAKAEISEYIKKHCSDWTAFEVEEGTSKVLQSYMRSKTFYGPVARAWAEYLLDHANRNKMQLVFMARDGFVPYKIVKKLMAQEEYQKRFPNLVGDKKIVLGFMSRKVIHSSQKNAAKTQLFKDYAEKELGITKGAHCLFVDVGFFGSMISPIRKLLPDVKIDFNFLISKTNEASGFVPPYEGFDTSQNLGVHWLEDTHQGNLVSPVELVKEVDGKIYANTARPHKRQFRHGSNHLDFITRKFSQRAVVRSYLDSPFKKPALELASKKFNILLEKIRDTALPIFTSHTEPIKADFEDLFTLGIFESYVNKLKGFVAETLNQHPALKKICPKGPFKHFLEKHTVELIDLVQSYKFSTHSARQFHQTFLKKLREVIDEKNHLGKVERPETVEAIKFISSLGECIYLGTNMLPELEEFMSSYISQDELKELSTVRPSGLSDWLYNQYLEIKSRLNVRKYKGFRADARMLGDLPTVLFEYPLAGRKIKVIRTPAVVKDVLRDNNGNLISSEVVEEFQEFLEKQKKEKRVHLYVNLMDKQSPSESIRTNSIEILQKEYPNTFHVMTLPKNTQFYYQSGPYDVPTMDSTAFKQKFLEELPDLPLGNEWRKKCSEALDRVHVKHFESSKVLNQKERQDFIEIAYLEIIETAMETIKPDSCNVSCLSTIDRGAAVLTELFLKCCLKDKKELTHEEKRKTTSLALAPAMLAQNRVMQKDRMDRLLSAMDRLVS